MTLTKRVAGPFAGITTSCGDDYTLADANSIFGVPLDDMRRAPDGWLFSARGDTRKRCPTHGDTCPERSKEKS